MTQKGRFLPAAFRLADRQGNRALPGQCQPSHIGLRVSAVRLRTDGV